MGAVCASGSRPDRFRAHRLAYAGNRAGALRLARESRDLAAQLEAAQTAAQRLSTSLDLDDVLDVFLGSVGERLGADVAAVYTFEDDGEVLVGRKRVLLREDAPLPEGMRSEDIRHVRAPVAMLPILAEAVSTGRTYVWAPGREGVAATSQPRSPATVAVPLLIGGHMVGIAAWEAYGQEYTFDRDRIAFAEALAASAAAAVRTVELFASLESARERATREAVRFAAVLDRMADAVVVVDSAGRVELSNPAARELLGPDATREPLQEWSRHIDIRDTGDRPLALTDFPLGRALRGERVARGNFILRRSGRPVRRIASSAAPLRGPAGELTGAAVVFRDVTDEHEYAELLLHKNRELLEQASMLEEMNRQLRDATAAKDRFLAVMSHELRTPLNAILGYTDLLDMGVKGDLNGEQKAMVARIRHTSSHLLGLITDVLDLAKIGAGRMDLVLAEIDIEEMVSLAVDQILPVAAGKGLDIDVTGDEGGGVFALADGTRLTQVVLNLLSNAVKFTEHGGVEVRYGRDGDQVVIRVRDTGPGIPTEQQDRIFEEFFQVEAGYARSSGGTGLGLAIVRRVMEDHGGRLELDDPPEGGGAIVRLAFARLEEGSLQRELSASAE
jgi:PAS domain S-box-containing protein